MINTILKTKHWVIFLITAVLPIIIYIFMIFSMVFSMPHLNNPPMTGNPFEMGYNPFGNLGIYMLLFFLATYGTYFAWTYSVNIGLEGIMPEGIKHDVSKFKLFWWITVIYFCILMLVFVTPFSMMFAFLMILIIPMNLFCMFSIFYIAYFTAKTLKMIELQRSVKFVDYGGEFCMILLMPIGIWAMQPKINNYMGDDESKENLPPQ